MIGKKWIYRETHSTDRVWAISEGQKEPGDMTWLDFTGRVISQATEWEDYSNYLGEETAISRNWATTHFLPFMISPRTILALVGVSFRCCLSTWMQSEKPQNDLCSFPRQTIQYQVIQVCAPTSNAEEAEVEQFYEDLQDLLELTHPKDVLFIIWDRNAKVRSPDTWSNRQIWCWSTE